jgi:hypothetical protein
MRRGRRTRSRVPGNLDVGTGREIEVDADQRGVRRAGGRRPAEGAHEHRRPQAVGGEARQRGVVLEGGCDLAVGVGQHDPELRAVQEPGVDDRRLLRVRDPVPGGHQGELARTELHVAAERVTVVHRALEQPRHRLQPGVRVWRHLHPGSRGDVVGAVVVDERPGPDHPPAQGGQQPADAGALAEEDLLGRQQVQRRSDGGGRQAAQLPGGRSAVEVAHGSLSYC